MCSLSFNQQETNRPTLSVVVPLHNEAENVATLHHEIVHVLESLPYPWEICYVDDGSTDDTYQRLCEAAGQDEHVFILRLSRRFGQSAALKAGFDATSGEIVITLDGDLQNDPRDIPRFLEKIAEGYDVVHGWRLHRHDALITRRLPSQVANFLIRKLTAAPTPDLGCGIRALRRWVVDQLELIGDMHRFLPVLAQDLGAHSAVIQVNHRPRAAGKSKYGLRRIFAVLADLPLLILLTKYRNRPIRFLMLLAALAGVVALLSGTAGLVSAGIGAFHNAVLLLVTGVLMGSFGSLFVALGFLAELFLRVGLRDGGLTPYVIRSEQRGDVSGVPLPIPSGSQRGLPHPAPRRYRLTGS